MKKLLKKFPPSDSSGQSLTASTPKLASHKTPRLSVLEHIPSFSHSSVSGVLVVDVVVVALVVEVDVLVVVVVVVVGTRGANECLPKQM